VRSVLVTLLEAKTFITLSFQKSALKDFPVTAHQAYFAEENNELLIFHAKLADLAV